MILDCISPPALRTQTAALKRAPSALSATSTTSSSSSARNSTAAKLNTTLLSDDISIELDEEQLDDHDDEQSRFAWQADDQTTAVPAVPQVDRSKANCNSPFKLPTVVSTAAHGGTGMSPIRVRQVGKALLAPLTTANSLSPKKPDAATHRLDGPTLGLLESMETPAIVTQVRKRYWLLLLLLLLLLMLLTNTRAVVAAVA
jgi:hypothetical protein